MRLSIRLPLHPSRAVLDAAVSSAPAHDVAGHLARCASCRAELGFRHALCDAVARLPEPEPSPTGLGEVLAARARGDRFVVPAAVGNESRTGRRFRRVAAAAALAVVAAWPVAAWWRAREAAHSDASGLATDDLAAADSRAASTGMFASVAVASGAPGLLAPPALHSIDGQRLHPMSLEYVSRRIDKDGHVTGFDGRGTLALVMARSPQGDVMWRLTREWHGGDWTRGGRTQSEVLWMEPSRLGLVARNVRIAPYSARYRSLTVTQRFLGDRMVGEIEADGIDGQSVRRPIAQALPQANAPYLTDALVPIFVGAVSPTYGWTGRATVTGWGVVPNDVAMPVTMRVVGEDRVTTPAGTFDCWRLTVYADGRSLDYWVRKRDGVAVRSRDTSPRSGRDGASAMHEVLLTADAR